MATESGDLLPGEIVQTEEVPAGMTPQQAALYAAKTKKAKQVTNEVRDALADTYTFVRSQELNRVIANYTFDHYIDEAKRRLKGQGREIVDAAGKVVSTDTTIGTRPSLFKYLESLEKRFTDTLAAAKKVAGTK